MFQGHRLLILVATAILVLLIASPVLQRLLLQPQTESFTELWLLDRGHLAEGFPHDITRGVSYNLYLGIKNQLGHIAHYEVLVKFRSSAQQGLDSLNYEWNSLPPLYSVDAIVADTESWELPVTFSFDYSYEGIANISEIKFSRLVFNDATLNLTGYSSLWDSEKSEFFGDLIFELWIYDEAVGEFVYSSRFVDLKLNMLI